MDDDLGYDMGPPPAAPPSGDGKREKDEGKSADSGFFARALDPEIVEQEEYAAKNFSPWELKCCDLRRSGVPLSLMLEISKYNLNDLAKYLGCLTGVPNIKGLEIHPIDKHADRIDASVNFTAEFTSRTNASLSRIKKYVNPRNAYATVHLLPNVVIVKAKCSVRMITVSIAGAEFQIPLAHGEQQYKACRDVINYAQNKQTTYDFEFAGEFSDAIYLLTDFCGVVFRVEKWIGGIKLQRNNEIMSKNCVGSLSTLRDMDIVARSIEKCMNGATAAYAYEETDWHSWWYTHIYKLVPKKDIDEYQRRVNTAPCQIRDMHSGADMATIATRKAEMQKAIATNPIANDILEEVCAPTYRPPIGDKKLTAMRRFVLVDYALTHRNKCLGENSIQTDHVIVQGDGYSRVIEDLQEEYMKTKFIFRSTGEANAKMSLESGVAKYDDDTTYSNPIVYMGQPHGVSDVLQHEAAVRNNIMEYMRDKKVFGLCLEINALQVKIINWIGLFLEENNLYCQVFPLAPFIGSLFVYISKEKILRDTFRPSDIFVGALRAVYAANVDAFEMLVTGKRYYKKKLEDGTIDYIISQTQMKAFTRVYLPGQARKVLGRKAQGYQILNEALNRGSGFNPFDYTEIGAAKKRGKEPSDTDESMAGTEEPKVPPPPAKKSAITEEGWAEMVPGAIYFSESKRMFASPGKDKYFSLQEVYYPSEVQALDVQFASAYGTNIGVAQAVLKELAKFGLVKLAD